MKVLELHGNWGHTIEFTASEICNFSKEACRLESLSLVFNNITLHDLCPSKLELPSIEFTKLKKLHLEGVADFRIILGILTRCRRSLQYLMLTLVNNEVLRAIYKKIEQYYSQKVPKTFSHLTHLGNKKKIRIFNLPKYS